MAVELVVPTVSHLDSYRAALRRRWSPNTMRPEAADDELSAIEEDPAAFLASKDDPTGAGPAIVQADGSSRPRLPGFTRWLWDGDFAGSINARWQPGTVELPPHVPGHVGYSIVPWRRRRGYATAAIGLLPSELRDTGLAHVDLTTDEDNIGSRRAIEANGGFLVGRVEPAGDPNHGDRGVAILRYRIDLEE